MIQKEFIGNGEFKKINNTLRIKDSDKIFFVTGKNSFNTSGAEKIIDQQFGNNEYDRFSDFTENPKFEDIIKGINLFKKKEYDYIIAVGGGSVVDIAKLVNVLSFQTEQAEKIIEGKSVIINKGIQLIVVPTTAGAGSEATHFAVVYNDKQKFSVAHKYLYPDTVILDPQLTYNLSPFTTASSGMDALSQAIESYWNVNSNDCSKNFSSKAIKLIMKNIDRAVNDPDEVSRYNMSIAANLAGKAINITKTTAPHAVSYSMTSHFGVSHGQAVSITLGEFLQYNYEVSESELSSKKSITEVRKEIEEIIKLLGSENVVGAKEKLSGLMKRIGLKTRLSELNINKEADIKLIMENVNLERLKNNPRVVSSAGLEKILRNIL